MAFFMAFFVFAITLSTVSEAAESKKTSTTRTSSTKTQTAKNQQKKTTSTSNAKTSNTKTNNTKKSTAKPAQKKPVTTSGAQNDLARVQQEIRSAENRIRLSQEQRDQAETELKQTEEEIGSLKENMGSIQQDAGSIEQRLQGLRTEKNEREQQRNQLINLVRSDLRMAQRQSGEDYYKLLLNQQDPQVLARLMKYYGYLQKARSDRVDALNKTVKRLDEIAIQEEKDLKQLQSLRSDLQKKQSKLVNAQKQRNKTIKLLNSQIESDGDKLQKLRRDQQALQSVIERLAREAAEREAQRRRQEQAKAQQAADAAKSEGKPPVPVTPVPDQPDYQLKQYAGRCPLPVSGGIRASFGSARAGGLRWNGIVVAAPAGTPVHAVLPGKVAFADYLRGYGFLIIVDHGRGLMSLYGQNQTLLKKTGDSVAGKEVIARVGDSGGNESDGLYFEIRMRGKPSDPANWCAYQ